MICNICKEGKIEKCQKRFNKKGKEKFVHALLTCPKCSEAQKDELRESRLYKLNERLKSCLEECKCRKKAIDLCPLKNFQKFEAQIKNDLIQVRHNRDFNASKNILYLMENYIYNNRNRPSEFCRTEK